MTTRKIVYQTNGGLRVTLEVLESAPGLHDYGIPRSAWYRAVDLMNRFGAEQALELVDARAVRAADRGDYETARRWRNLITAIHAIQEDELSPDEDIH